MTLHRQCTLANVPLLAHFPHIFLFSAKLNSTEHSETETLKCLHDNCLEHFYNLKPWKTWCRPPGCREATWCRKLSSALSYLDVLDSSMFLTKDFRLGCSSLTNLVGLPYLSGPAASGEDSVHTRQVWSFLDVPDACTCLTFDVPDNEL